MKAAVLGGLAVAAIAAAFIVRANAPKPPGKYGVEHRPQSGWNREQGTPSTVFLYRHEATRCLISGSLSHAPEGVAAQSGPIKAQSMASTPLRMRALGEVRSGEIAFGLVSRGGWDSESLTAFGSKGRTTLAVTLSGPTGAAVRSRRAEFERFLGGIQFRRSPD